MKQPAVTPAMPAWAVQILRDPGTYPMFATVSNAFGQLNVLARVEWHPPDFQGAKQANLLRGAYHFFRPMQDAAAQARLFLAQLSDPGELPPGLDVEAVNGAPLAVIAAGVGTRGDARCASRLSGSNRLSYVPRRR